METADDLSCYQSYRVSPDRVEYIFDDFRFAKSFIDFWKGKIDVEDRICLYDSTKFSVSVYDNS